MKPIVTRLYAVLVALTFVGLAVWSGADWYQLQQKAQEVGRSELRQAAGLVSDLTLHPGALEATGLGRVFSQVPGADPHWKMLLLVSPDRGTEYYRGPRPVVSIDRAVPRWEPQSLSEVKVTLPVFRAVGEPLTLEGIYQFYGRGEIFQLLKACGITLVVLLVLTTIVVFLSARARDPEEEEAEASAESDTWDSEPELEVAAETIGTMADEKDEDYWFDETLTMEDLPPLEEPEAAPFRADAPPPPRRESDYAPITHSPQTVAASSAPSLFAPDSGLGWEAFLPTRLDFELDRSSGQNQDLALILFEIKTGAVTPGLWGRIVREAFPSSDLDFECEGGAAVVLPGRTLEQAIQSARAFLETADRTFGGALVHAGVAARAGRLLSSATLLGEAVSAKRRSLAGTVRVLGLKTDPDRYRAHLASASA